MRRLLATRAGALRAPPSRLLNFFATENVLSEENVKRTVAKFTNMKAVRLQPHEPAKKAAVLVPVCVVDNEVSLLYTLRAPNLKTHRGQVSFPGGMQDLRDDSLEGTAVRETKEELGIDRRYIELWCCGNIIVTRSDMCVVPVLGRVKSFNRADLKLNPEEVEEVFTVPLRRLCDPAHLRHTQFRGSYSTPVFTGGERRIWGLTAVITNMFLRALLPAKAYSHRIRFVPAVQSPKTLF